MSAPEFKQGRTAIDAPGRSWFARYVRRRRWANNVARAQRVREAMTFSQRQTFDSELRPYLEDGNRIAYPDAFYYVSIEDWCRAFCAAHGLPHR